MKNNSRLSSMISCIPYSTEKSNILEKFNTFIFRVNKNLNKREIKNLINKIYNVQVDSVNTLLVKNKLKTHKHTSCRSWKKAYVSFNKGQNIDFLSVIK